MFRKMVERLRRLGTGAAQRGGGAGGAADVEAAEEWAAGTPAVTTGWGATGFQASDCHWGPDDGVEVEPTPITGGEQVTVRYQGLLGASGAEQVYLHYGYGPGPWRDVSERPMSRETSADGREVWTVTVPVTGTGAFNFCFRDNAYNWDNNRGRDWSYQVHWGEMPPGLH